jgi:hypothetical protein
MLRSMGTDKVLVKPFDLDSYLSLGAVIRDTCLSGT